MDKNAIIGSIMIGLIVVFWLSRSQPTEQQPSAPKTVEQAQAEEREQTGWRPLSLPDQEEVVWETPLYRVRFSLVGAQLQSLELLKHQNDEKLANMVRIQEQEPAFFALDLPGIKQAATIPFTYQKRGNRHLFLASIELDDGSIYHLEKEFQFSQVGYMIGVDIRIKGEDNAPLSKLTGAKPYLYRLSIGPQIGPDLGKIGNRTSPDTRTYQYYDNQKVRRAKAGRTIRLEESLLWAAISGKYFTVIGLPRRGGVHTIFDSTNGDFPLSKLIFERQFDDGSSFVDDNYYYYAGPKRTEELIIYEANQDNDFGLSNLRLTALSRSGSILGWLEQPIKWILQAIYNYLIPNYGIAIILLAILIRVLLAPLTIKSYRSTMRMQALQPKMKALQQRYKDDQLRLQRELSQLYKKEGVSPLGGCLPILLQMPVIIALANLFYRYFEFRGAVFIPGWIDDLSAPETIYSFSIPASVPLLGETVAIRILPVLYLGSQLFLSRIMQKGNPSQSMGQMKLVMQLMPFMFFFILYNMPSGLIMYWTISNILIMLQQVFMGKHGSKSQAVVPVKRRRQRQKN